MLPFQTQTLSIPTTKITNDTCKNFTLSLPTAKKQETIMYQTDSFKTSVTAVKAACTCKLLQLKQLVPASYCSYCNCYLTSSWSAWSWSWLVIAALPLPPLTASGLSYDASRIASHRDSDWHASLQHLYLWLVNRPPQKVCMIHKRPTNHACWVETDKQWMGC